MKDFPVLTTPIKVTSDFRDKLVIQTAAGNKSPILITRIFFSIHTVTRAATNHTIYNNRANV
jgi:hypothetical protein